MLIRADPPALQLVDEHVHRRRVLIPGDHHAVDLQIIPAKIVDQPKDLQIVGDPEIMACLTGGDIAGVDADDDLRLVLQPLQQLDLGVLIEARQHSGRVLVMHQLTAEFQIQPLAAGVTDSLTDIL